MKLDKKYIFSALLGCTLLIIQSGSVLAESPSNTESDMSPYKWGHWSKMTQPAAGPAPVIAPTVNAPAPPTPVAVPVPPTPTKVPATTAIP